MMSPLAALTLSITVLGGDRHLSDGDRSAAAGLGHLHRLGLVLRLRRRPAGLYQVGASRTGSASLIGTDGALLIIQFAPDSPGPGRDLGGGLQRRDDRRLRSPRLSSIRPRSSSGSPLSSAPSSERGTACSRLESTTRPSSPWRRCCWARVSGSSPNISPTP